MYFIFLIVGIICLWLSSELLIYALRFIAERLHISDTFVGLTLLSIGTTLPEIGTHVVSSLQILQGNDVSSIAIGTNIGSNIFQISLILGVVALLYTVHAYRTYMHRDYIVMLCAILLLILFAANGHLGRLEGVILVVSYLLYLSFLGKQEHLFNKINHTGHRKGIFLHLLYAICGAVFLFFSANLVVSNAQALADALQVTQSLIGTLIVGFGTALPELAAVLVAFRRKAPSMSLGVLVGSNITNPLLGIGLGAVISTYNVSKEIFLYDLPMWLLLSVIAYLFLWRDLKLSKREGLMLVGLYVVYAIIRIVYIG